MQLESILEGEVKKVALRDLSDAELGAIVREGPLWPILLKMESKNEKKAAGSNLQHDTDQIRTGGGNVNVSLLAKD